MYSNCYLYRSKSDIRLGSFELLLHWCVPLEDIWIKMSKSVYSLQLFWEKQKHCRDNFIPKSVQYNLPNAALGSFVVLSIALSKLPKIKHRRESIYGVNYSCSSILIKVNLNISAHLWSLYTKGQDVNFDQCNWTSKPGMKVSLEPISDTDNNRQLNLCASSSFIIVIRDDYWKQHTWLQTIALLCSKAEANFWATHRSQEGEKPSLI